jgi:3-oxoacyl-[acyl-carrier-protein] synthase II
MRDGEADIMIAGGSEAALTPLCFSGFVALTAMVTKYNDTPEKASRPFDKERYI